MHTGSHRFTAGTLDTVFYAQYNSSLCELGKRQLPSSSFYKSIYRQCLFKETTRLYIHTPLAIAHVRSARCWSGCGFCKSIEHAARAAECKNAQIAKLHTKYKKDVMFTALGSISHKFLYVPAKWTKTRIPSVNFDFHFQMPPRVFPMSA